MSNFGWIDFSIHDRELARDIMASLNEPGAVDELGIGVIRDAFADYFFPGTSTIQTIAKYFFLVSYQLEKLTNAPETNLESKLREIEYSCSLAMWNSLSSQEKKSGSAGVFGRTFFERKSENEIKRASSTDWVKRAPSVVYWSGIRKLGLWKSNNSALSLVDFLRLSANQDIVPVESDEDIKNGKKYISGFEKSWHWNLPPVEARGDWQNNPSVKLTSGEANFFLEQIKKELPATMFAFLVDFIRNKHYLPLEFSDLQDIDLPDHLQKTWKLAYDFSEFIKPAQIRFNVLLGNEIAKQKWENYSKETLSNLSDMVDLSAIFTLLNLEKHYTLRNFLTELKKIYHTDVRDIDELLFRREKQLKGISRMKLGKEKENPYYHDVWVGGCGLQYRYPDACRLLCNAKDEMGVE